MSVNYSVCLKVNYSEFLIKEDFIIYLIEEFDFQSNCSLLYISVSVYSLLHTVCPPQKLPFWHNFEKSIKVCDFMSLWSC